MIKYIYEVRIHKTAKESDKGKELAQMALGLKGLVIHGKSVTLKVINRMEEIAAAIDAKYPGTLPTKIVWLRDDKGIYNIGAISLSIFSKVIQKLYFSIEIETVDQYVSIDDVLNKHLPLIP